jgi:hypothetical protein
MSKSSDLVPAHPVPWDEVRTSADADIFLRLSGSPEFIGAATLREQSDHACELLREKHQPVVPDSTIGRILGIDKSAVRYHARRYLSHSDEAGLHGRPPVIDAAKSDELFARINEAYAKGAPWTVGEISRYVRKRWNLTVDKNTLRHLFKRDPRLNPHCVGRVPAQQHPNLSPGGYFPYC